MLTIDELRTRLTLTVEEAGACYGISRWAAYSAVRSGAIPSIRIGRRLVVPAAAVRAALGIPEAAP